MQQGILKIGKDLQYDDDGEIIETNTKLYLDEDKIREEEQFDGYYSIITGELNLSDSEIIDIMNQALLPDSSAGAKKEQTLRFSSFALIDSLRKYTCSIVSENLYNFQYTDPIIQSIEKVFGFDLSLKYRKRGDIKKIIASAKK